MFLIIDGIDGSGKGAIVDALGAELAGRGAQVADARPLMKQTGAVPTPDDLGPVQFILTAEPTYAWVGRAIREALVKDSAYDPRSVAQAFAVDREIHYRRLVLPARAKGVAVISERGVSGSLAYQVTSGVPESEILELPGNRLALENPPDILVIAKVDVPTALQRLEKRAGKQDGSYYERRPFLEALTERFADPGFRRIFTDRGARVLELSTEGELSDTLRRVREELLPLI